MLSYFSESKYSQVFYIIQPVGEPKEKLRDTIQECKSSMELRGYKKAAVVFLISRVGTSEEARNFLDEIRNDKEVGDIVYSSKEDLNEKWEVFKAGEDNAAYSAWVSIHLAFSFLFSTCGLMS